MDFWADRKAALTNRPKIAALSPMNPFCDSRYIQWREGLGHQPMLVGLESKGEIVAGCPAFLSARYLINRTLELPTLPELPAPERFWDGLFRFCRRNWISYLFVENNFGAVHDLPAGSGSSVSGELIEYRLDMTGSDPWTLLSKRHRGSVKKARNAGVQMRSGTPEDAFREHATLVAASFGRHIARGEQIEFRARDEYYYRSAVECGLGRLFQAEWEGRLMSSVIMIRSARGAFYLSGGSSPDGLGIGAGAFAVHEATLALRQEGIELVNVGHGVESSQDQGISFFKAGFGGTPSPIRRAEYFQGGPLRRAVARIRKRMSGR